MFFSVVIPIYKVEKYLRECVDSVLNQTFDDYEIILVDDGSPDSCPAICDEYAEKYDKVKVIHKPNGGLSDARNAGTRMAQGEYIIYIDSDDYFAENTLFEKIKEKTENKPDVVLCKFKKYFEKNNQFGKCGFSFANIDEKAPMYEILNSLAKNDAFYCAAWAKAIKRSTIVENNVAFTLGLISEDIDWYWQVLFNVKSIALLDEVAVIYRQRPGSITAEANEKSLSSNVDILENWSSKIKELNDENLKSALLNAMGKIYCNVLILYSNSKEWRKKYKSRLKAMDFLLNSSNPRAVKMRKIYKIFGFTITTRLLNIARKIKR